MTWDAAMRWALIRARETGRRQRVYGYCNPVNGKWCYSTWVAR